MKPHLKEMLIDVDDRLIKGEYDLMIIQFLKDIEHQKFLQKLKIFSRIDIQLTRDVSKFERQISRQMLFLFSRQMSSHLASQMLSFSRRRHLLTSQIITQAITQTITQMNEKMKMKSEMKNTIEKDETHNLKYDYTENKDD